MIPGLSKPPSGMEMMLKQLGLGDVITAAQKLASSGSVEKILKFADDVEQLNVRFETVQAQLDRIKARMQLAAGYCPQCGGPTEDCARPEPGSDAAHGGLDEPGAGARAPEEPGADRGPGAPGAAGGVADGRRGRAVRQDRGGGSGAGGTESVEDRP